MSEFLNPSAKCTTRLAPAGHELVSSVAFSKNDELAVGDNNGDTYLYNSFLTGPPVAALSDAGSSAAGVSAVAFSPDGSTLAVADRVGSIYLYDVATHHQIAVFTEPGGRLVNSVAFSPDGKLLASGDSNGRAYVWNLGTRTEQTIFKDPGGSTGGVSSVAFSPDGSTLATGDGDDSTYLWDM